MGESYLQYIFQIMLSMIDQVCQKLVTSILTSILLCSYVNADDFLPPPIPKLEPVANSYIPSTSYELLFYKNVDIFLSPHVVKDKQLKEKIIERLTVQIKSMYKLLPLSKLSLLDPIQIWVELNTNDSGYAEYHAYEDWLQANRHNPDKYKSIEITNTLNYLRWSSKDPLISSVLIHEIAHAYFHSLSEEDKSKVNSAYIDAKKKGLYKNVFRLGTTFQGKQVRIDQAWARKDKWEYFSELTESIFAKNDYFPHTSNDLAKYDPVGYKLVRSLWN